MDKLPASEWFLMPEVRRRRLATAVWVPLRQAETLHHAGEPGKVGEQDEVLCAGSVAFYSQHRTLAEGLGWTDIGLMHTAEPYAFRDGRYKPVDAFMHNDAVVIGVELVFEQRLNRDHPPRWLINQDLTMALGLIEEGDVWRCANEGYTDVIRSRRDRDGRVVAIEMKTEFLRDYLAARGLALRVAQYRQRMAILQDASYLPWMDKPIQEGKQPDRFSARVFEVDTSGELFGGSVAVFQSWRTDVDDDEDVQVFGPENDDNTASRTFRFERAGATAYRVEGELWREEWIEPADRSTRVRGDQPAEEFFYSIDATGSRAAGATLNSEDVGRYLWFRPTIIPTLLQHRGAELSWYSKQTGSVKCSPDYETHFGVNRHGFINVYAYDVAKLPHWQQQLWSGHNATPDGPVSTELLDAQQRCEPAATKAPESEFCRLLAEVNSVFLQRFSGELFKTHESTAAILKRIHRFRAIDGSGILALAKDIARLTADSVDVGVLRAVIAPTKGENWRSLRHLEYALAKQSNTDSARKALTPLVGVYELRLGDAHLPSSKIQDAYKLVGVDPADQPVSQAVALIESAVSSLEQVLHIISL